MPDELTPIIIASIAALPGLLALLAQRKKTSADAASAITDAAGDMVTQYRTRLEVLERDTKALRLSNIQLTERVTLMNDDVFRLEALVKEYRRGILILMGQIESLGDNPAYKLAALDD